MLNVQFNKEELLQKGVTSFHLFNFAEQTIIRDEISRHHLTRAPTQVGKVNQYFDEGDLSHALSPKTLRYIEILKKYLKKELKGYLPWGFSFNEIRIQQYLVPEKDRLYESGISDHRDRSRYKGIIAVLVFEDGGDFVAYTPDPKNVVSERGYCIVMKGSSFGNESNDTRIKHAVESVSFPRLTIGLRFDTKFTLPRFMQRISSLW